MAGYYSEMQQQLFAIEKELNRYGVPSSCKHDDLNELHGYLRDLCNAINSITGIDDNNRFNDTLCCLNDCSNHIDDENLTKREQNGRKSLIALCMTILESQNFKVEKMD